MESSLSLKNSILCTVETTPESSHDRVFTLCGNLLDLGQSDYVAQATKTGQLILLNRIDGNPTEKIIEKKFNVNNDNKNSFTVKRNFPDWLTYSRNNFTKDDINKINKQFILKNN